MNEMFEKRGPVDMSPEAIAQRLRDLQQLYLFSMSLSRAKFIDATQQGSAQAATPTTIAPRFRPDP
ncbi:MAG TPA: hypothetical protein VMM76_25530 [Pirellulaceae bacterium]|nr:hypothetical protein [Pirellulaceae bacterium]